MEPTDTDKGRRLLFIVLGVYALAPLVFAGFALATGNNVSSSVYSTYIFLLFFCACALARKNWARIVLGALGLLVFVGSLADIGIYFSKGAGHAINKQQLIAALIYGPSAAILLFSRAIRAHFKAPFG